MSETKEYTAELQQLFIEFLVQDKDLFLRVNNILEASYFNRPLRKTVQFLQEHVASYGALPTNDQISALTGIKLAGIGDTVDDRHKSWFIDEFESFCKHKALEAAILQSADLVEKGEFGEVERIIKEAVQVGLAKHMGINYWDDPKERINAARYERAGTSTGWKSIDYKLFGGFNQGELNIFCAQSGGGKSLFLQNLALNWSLMGKNVLYVSLELSEQLSGLRLDGMLTGMNTKAIFNDVEGTALKVGIQGKNAGILQIIQVPSGITTNDLTSYMREFEVQNGVRIDAMLVDYLDLMTPAGRKINASDLFIKDKYVSEDLRNFAVENNILFATASQLNRSAVEEVEFDHSHISGGLSKIQTADNVIGIFTSQAMRERGRYQIQFMKTRSSSGVGQKVDLAFDIEGLRITDLPDDEQDTITTQSSTIYEKLKKKNTIVESPNEPMPEATSTDDQAARLRSILRKQD
jgi:replicative DNA helicase